MASRTAVAVMLLFTCNTAMAWLMSHAAPLPQRSLVTPRRTSSMRISMRVVHETDDVAMDDEEDDFTRMQASLVHAQERLDGWGRGDPGVGNDAGQRANARRGNAEGSWAWSGGATPASVLEGTALALKEGKVRVQA